jgi:hypothetical protein
MVNGSRKAIRQRSPAGIAQVDLLTSVGNHITKKTRRTFPAFADRCETACNGIDAREFSREKDYAALRQRKIKRIFIAVLFLPARECMFDRRVCANCGQNGSSDDRGHFLLLSLKATSKLLASCGTR